MGSLYSLFTKEEQPKVTMTEEQPKVTMTVTKEDSTTEYHRNGTRIERKTVTTCTLIAPDAENFKSQLLSGVKAIEFY